MCKGKQTEMSCGHVLTQYTERCQRGKNKPCPEPVLEAPLSYINDSCAQCDPEFNMNQISREHKQRHAELVEQLYENKKAGRSEAVQQLLERMEKLRRSADRALGEVQVRCPPPSLNVQFPVCGYMGEWSKWTSRWVNGKCVWEEERPWKPGMGKVKRIYRSPTTPPPPPTAEAEEQLASRKPRMRRSKKEYTTPPSLNPPEERPVISGPPRLRREKPYSGPRDICVIVDPQDTQLQQQRNLRRTKRYVDVRIFGSADSIDQGSGNTVKHIDKEQVGSPSSGMTVRLTAPAIHVTPEDDEEEEDLWLTMAEKTIKNKGKSFSQRLQDRIALERGLIEHLHTK
ncbi:hypothetical protein F4776DRAFT_24146 [Hypoxylon sp. NC0597]|nr:hypothetical protein F4776DRAFT_24146 [Hypoxylon sp. NC0597]